ncbi:hypothetical protein GD597_06865 [Panacibacter sp. KCS-6]|uniref:Uncharacterized protein n=1 Tax=Limnovirga soli TaxID=2656915 RepID=A0A8J8JSW1_9BACT|nr:hypothetical protein [Limnovirga soli]
MRNFIILYLLTFTLNSFGQYPFEKYPAIKYKVYKDWKVYNTNGKEKKTEFILTIPKFYDKIDSLTLVLTSFAGKWDSSYITVFKNGKQIQRFFEPMLFYETNLFEPIMLADVNGDNLQDIKLIVPYMGNGTASLNTRVIYLFQQKDKNFIKISFMDKMSDNRPERDFNGDGNYEVITMTLTSYQYHSYWSFNLFNFKKNDFVSTNNKYNYPILIQFLNRDNFKITNKISRQKMKDFGQTKPADYDRK